MSLFSSDDKKPSEKSASAIPEEFISAVTVMSDELGGGSRPASPSPSRTAAADEPSVSRGQSSGNPFLDTEKQAAGRVQKAEPSPAFGEASEGRMLENTPASAGSDDEFSPVESERSEKRGNSPLIIGAVVLVTVLLGASIAYYFLEIRSAEEEAPGIAAPETPLTGQEPVSQVLPFSLDMPNYLSIDTEAATAEDIRKTFSQSAASIASAGIMQPVEFLITDQNNNPIAFSRFAVIAELDVVPDLLSLIDEGFSLHLYNDSGQSRIGLTLALKDAASAAPMISKEEENLPYVLRTVLYDMETDIPRKAMFSSSTYDTQAIRYVNIGGADNLSLDYAVRGNEWILGTSKNTLRAILDKN